MSKEQEVKEKSLATQKSLADLLSISFMENEENEDQNKVESALQVFAKDLVPNKVDAIAYFVDREDFAIKADEQYLKDLKKRTTRRKNAFEKVKKYFAKVLEANGFTGENRLNGITSSIYSSYAFEQKEDLSPDVIPAPYKQEVVIVTFIKEVYDSIMNVDNPPPVLKLERDTLVDMKTLKEDLQKEVSSTIKELTENPIMQQFGYQEEEKVEEDIFSPYYDKNVHLKVGKSNKKGKTNDTVKKEETES